MPHGVRQRAFFLLSPLLDEASRTRLFSRQSREGGKIRSTTEGPILRSIHGQTSPSRCAVQHRLDMWS